MPEATTKPDANLDALDRRLIVATQSGLPRVSRPYDVLAEELDIAADEVLRRLQRMLDVGVIRRIGAVPNHYAIGYTANGMSVWDVDDARIDELGARVGALSFVTHCYRRPRRLPDWPYNLFSMVHARSMDACEQAIAAIAEDTGLTDPSDLAVLYSTHEYKKIRLEYFTPEYREWEERALAGDPLPLG